MIFYDREEKLALLGEMLRGSAEEARMTVVTGRRRVGKTDLCLGCGGKMPEGYFIRKLRESGAYTRVSQYWDRKGGTTLPTVKEGDKRRD